jgi:hypothetical protein
MWKVLEAKEDPCLETGWGGADMGRLGRGE